MMTSACDAILAPFAHTPPLWGLLVVSFATGAALVWLFGRVSCQQRLRTIKAAMKGRLLEVWLFREQLRNVMKAEWRLFLQTGQYLLWSLPAFLVLMIPALLVMTQLQAHYGYRPLMPGGHILLKVFTADAAAMDEVALQLPDGLVQETPALRIPRSREVDFRIGATKPGQYSIEVQTGGVSVSKTLQVGPEGGAISPIRATRFLDRFLCPTEPGLPAGPIATVEVGYAPATVAVGGWNVHWIWIFLIVSIAAGYALKGVFRVEL